MQLASCLRKSYNEATLHAAMQSFDSKLRRRIWQPLLLILAAGVATPIVFSFFLPPTVLWLWLYAFLFVGLVLAVGMLLTRRIVSPVLKLANLTEELEPGLLQRTSTSQPSDEITALTQTVTAITTQMRQKEQTWMGDLERRNQAVQHLSRSLQEQAASFETALNSMDLPICLFEPGGNILQVNQRFRQFLGTSVESLKGMDLLSIVSELRKRVAEPDRLTAEAEAIFRKPSVSRDATFPLKEGSGSVRLYCVPLFGEISSLIGMIISTGESADTSVVEHLKSEFISTVSHELRTPLTAIKGAVGLVLGGAGGPVPGPIRDLLEIASHNTDRLILLVNDILEIFRMETGKLRLRPAATGLAELVGKACAQTQKDAETAGVRLETRLAPHLPPALVDAEQVQKVLEKLISNAIKFSYREGVVRIGAEPLPENSKFLLLWVQDFGRGIPLEAQERIFQKFEQAESVMTRQRQGSGLGLAICRGIVEGHGGRIWVKSEPRKGSTFFLSLPITHSAMPLPSAKLAPAPSPPSAAARRLVMVVEDDPDSRSVISRMLQTEGHLVVEVGAGSQVTELALRHYPEVIALDMILPDIPGLEVLRQLKANEKTRRIPVICMSVSDDLSSQSLQLGAAQFLRKPLEVGGLLRAIHTVCSAAATQTG